MLTMEQVGRMKARLGEGEEYPDTLLRELLYSAGEIILDRRYPFGGRPEGVEPQHQGLQVRIAMELLGKLGAEGQVAHSENGIARSWSSADVSPALLSAIVPKAQVL